MVAAMLSPFLHRLALTVSEMEDQERGLVDNGVIENLIRNLNGVRFVLDDAEKRELVDDSVKAWMEELKDLSFAMDDVLDEWKTATLLAEEEANNARGQADDQSASLARKITVRFLNLCRCFNSSPLTQVHHRLDVSHKMENLSERLDGIAARKETFNFRISGPLQAVNFFRVPFFGITKLVGQEACKKILIDRLLGEGGEEGRDLHIIPIVGVRGVGKTTLAKLAFNDSEVQKHFAKRIWICVSEPFDVAIVVNDIMNQLTGRSNNYAKLEDLIESLSVSIKDQKFLLVLDNMLTHDYQKWEILEKILRLGTAKSRVLVTTHKTQVLEIMGVSEHSKICVNELSDMDSWSLFSQIAFLEKSEEEQEILEPIGRQVARRCNGSPFAAKILGSLLRIKRTEEEWLNVLHSEIWRLERLENKLFYPLLLSYFDMTPIEKCCFSYFMVFLKDQWISKDYLIDFWMAQGCFSILRNAEEEMNLGRKCVESFARRSLFQDFSYSTEENTIESCKIHDIVHDFAQFLTSNEHRSLVVDDVLGKIDLNSRHLTILVPSNQARVSPLFSISNPKNLRSLTFMVNSEISENGVIDWCLGFKRLRTLILRDPSTKNIPESIGDLIHLRYLALYCPKDDGDQLEELPTTLGNLCNLQTLKLDGFCLPKEAEKLVKLTNLECVRANKRDPRCKSTVSFLSLPKGIHKMRSLKMLAAKFCSSMDEKINEKFQLQDLGNLDNLHSLILDDVGIDQGHVGGAIEAQLHRKTNLSRLLLRFDKNQASNFEAHEAVLEALQPPSRLSLLNIRSYSARFITSSWMISSPPTPLNNLKVLIFEALLKCEALPPLGKLQSLERLVMFNLPMVKEVGPEFLGMLDMEDNDSISSGQPSVMLFPRLKCLEFLVMPSWSKWTGVPAGWNKVEHTRPRIMPCLQHLSFRGCQNLEALPEFIEATPLKNLIVVDSQKLESGCQSETGKEWAKVRRVPNIMFHG